MKEKKEKKTIKCSYAVLVIILFAALAFVTDYTFIERKTRKCDCPKCEATNNEVISGDIENKDNTDDTQVNEENNNNDNIDAELKGVKEFTVPFDDSRSFEAKIVDGNIQLKFDGKEITLETLNAKEMYYITYHQGGCYILFYITEDNNLYQLSNDLYIIFNGTTIIQENIAIPILLAENVTNFLGNGKIYPSESGQAYGFPCEYITVLDGYGHANKIFFEQQHYFGGQKNTIVK